MGMFGARKQETVLEAKTRALNAPDTDFHNGPGAATKGCEITRNSSFRRKVCGAKPNGHFRAPKWCAKYPKCDFWT